MKQSANTLVRLWFMEPARDKIPTPVTTFWGYTIMLTPMLPGVVFHRKQGGGGGGPSGPDSIPKPCKHRAAFYI